MLNRKTISLLLSFALTIQAENAFAVDEQEQQGLTISLERMNRDKGWQNSVANLEMLLHNVRGDVANRKMTIKSMELDDDSSKTLSIFKAPRDIKNTAMLAYSYNNKANENWIFLPALKRIKRISSSNQSGPFMGSEFSYEDLASFEVDKYTYKFLRNEKYEKQDCFVVEAYPIDEDSGYKKTITWIDHKHYRAQKVDYYDLKDDLLKTQLYADYKLHKNKHWRAMKIKMQNHQTGKMTELNWLDFTFQTEMTEQEFSTAALRRIH